MPWRRASPTCVTSCQSFVALDRAEQHIYVPPRPLALPQTHCATGRRAGDRGCRRCRRCRRRS